MKKILIFITIFFNTISTINAEDIKRIMVGNIDAKITIIAFESLTCSTPSLKKNTWILVWLKLNLDTSL